MSKVERLRVRGRITSKNRGVRSAARARSDDRAYSAVCKGGATTPSRMQRAPNSGVILSRALGPRRRLLIAAIFLSMGALGFAAGRTLLAPSQEVTQPIAFNHRLHVGEAEIECETCHQHVRISEHAGLPSLATCMDCHDDPDADSPELRKLFVLAQSQEPTEFRKTFHLPDHVYYSHRRHVQIEALECASCHGGIAETQEPPARALVQVDMDFCIACHARSGVDTGRATGCIHCHR